MAVVRLEVVVGYFGESTVVESCHSTTIKCLLTELEYWNIGESLEAAALMLREFLTASKSLCLRI